MNWWEEDLWMQAEFAKKPAAPAPSKHMVRGRASLFDYDHDEVEDISTPEIVVKTVRGRPIKYKRDARPGGRPANCDVTKQIREVSGLGYSNEFIEKSLKINGEETNENHNLMPNLNFSSPAKSDSSSTFQTVSSNERDSPTPRSWTPKNSSRSGSPKRKWTPKNKVLDIRNKEEFPALT